MSYYSNKYAYAQNSFHREGANLIGEHVALSVKAGECLYTFLFFYFFASRSLWLC